MTIPEFPQSRDITLEDKAVFDQIFTTKPPEISAYTFTNIFAWRLPYNTTLSRINDSLVVSERIGDKTVCLEPLGGSDTKAVIDEVFNRSDDVEFKLIHAQVADQLKEDANYIVEYDRDNSDYLYLSEDLIELKGKKYDGKRNFITRFKSKYDYEYIRMPHVSPDEAMKFADYWCKQRKCPDSLKMEHQAVYEMLSNYDELGITGGAIKVDGQIVAFSLGEALNPETLVIHVEKAATEIEGIYQAINNEFASHAGAAFRFINREQDLGIPGLRKAKKSYHPIKMIETYKIKRA